MISTKLRFKNNQTPTLDEIEFEFRLKNAISSTNHGFITASKSQFIYIHSMKLLLILTRKLRFEIPLFEKGIPFRLTSMVAALEVQLRSQADGRRPDTHISLNNSIIPPTTQGISPEPDRSAKHRYQNNKTQNHPCTLIDFQQLKQPAFHVDLRHL